MKLIKALQNKTISYTIVSNTNNTDKINDFISHKIKESSILWFQYRLLSISTITKIDTNDYIYSFKITQ